MLQRSTTTDQSRQTPCVEHINWAATYFTGLRQSEQFALQVDDCDLANGKINVTKAVVEEEMKNRTKTNQDRDDVPPILSSARL